MTHPRPAPPSGADAERAAFLRDLRALRDQAGLRPQELAARAHFPEETLTSAEAGPALPSLPVLQAYVRGCGAAAGSAEWEDRWRRLTQDPDVETALPTRAPTVSRAPAGPFGAAVGTGLVNPGEQAAIGFGLARVAASLSPAGAGTSSWFSRADLEQPESANTAPPSYPPPSYPPTPAAPAAQAPASPASSMPESLTTWRPGTRETWGQEQQPGLDRRRDPDQRSGPDRQGGPDQPSGPDRQGGSAPSWGQAGQPAPSAPVSPAAPGGFSQPPPSGTSGFSRVPGPPEEFSPAPRPAGLPSATQPSGLAPSASGGALPQGGGPQRGAPTIRRPESPGGPPPRTSGAQGGTSGAQGGTSGARPAVRDDRAPAAQKTTGPLHSAEAPPAPGSRSGRTIMATVMIVLAVALIAVLIWLALAS